MSTRTISPPGEEYYRVRVVLPGVVLHLASAIEPAIAQGDPFTVEADWLDDPAKGDTIGFIDWRAVVGVTWRYTGEVHEAHHRRDPAATVSDPRH